jgi:hypothetical protein
MKYLSKTQSGGWVVELSEFEDRELRRLTQAVEGMEIHDSVNDSRQIYYASDHRDIASVFDAIRMFYEARFYVNEFENFVKRLRGATFPNAK